VQSILHQRRPTTMDARKAPKEHGKGMQRNYAQFLIRNDIQEHLRRIYPLCDQTKRHPQTKSISTDSTAALANTYLLAADALQLFSLYQMAVQAEKLTEHTKSHGPDTAVSRGNATCFHRLYADQWTQMTAEAKRSIRKDFDKTMHVGSILVGLVAHFGTGVLLTCTPKVQKMYYPRL
jgi:hypothetical protein